MISAFQHKSKFNFELFWKKFKFYSFHAVVLAKTFLLMYQLPMQDWYWRSYGDFSSSAQVKIRISNFFEKNQIFGFSCCSTREDLSIDVSITNVGLILTKLWDFFSRGTDRWTDRQTDRRTDRQTDRRTDRLTDTVLESSYGNMSEHKKFQLKSLKQLLVSCRSLYMPPRRTGMHNWKYVFTLAILIVNI